MAVFNPDVGGVPAPNMPDQTGASRGMSANRAWEALFEGVGDLIGGTAAAIDTDIKTSIRNDANSVFETANQPYEAPPADLSKGTESIKNLHAAWEQGKLSDVHYYGLLNTELKSLRAKYPGYEDVVDATIQEVTGVRPANAYRNALISEFNAQAAEAGDTEKSWKSWENQNQSTIAFLYPDYFTNPDKYSTRRGEVRAEVARYDGIKENDKYIKDTNADAVYSTAAASLGFDVSTTIGNLPKLLGLEDDNIYQFLEKASKVAPSAEESLALTASLDQLILQTEANIDNQMMMTRETSNARPGDPPVSWFGILGSTRAKEIKDQVLGPLKNIRQYINNGDFALAAYNTKLVEAMKTDDVAKLLNGSGGEFFRAKMAADAVDPELFNQWVAANPDARDNAYTQAIPELLARIAQTPEANTNAIAASIANDTKMSEADRAAALKQLIGGVNTTLAYGSYATPDQIAQTVQNTYDISDGEDVFSLVSDEDFMDVYTTLFSQDITANVLANGTPEAIKTYKDAAIDRFQSVPEFRDAAAALKNFIEIDKRLGVGVAEGGEIFVRRIDAGAPAGTYDAMQDKLFDARVDKANQAIGALNHAFRLLDPILLGEKTSGEDRDKLHLQLLETLSVNYGAGKQQDFFEWLGQEALKAFTPKEGASGEGNKSSWDLSEVDFQLPEEIRVAGVDANITDVIKGFEGIRTNAYWDVNAYRTGYGSDTITLADGTVQTVTRNSRITQADADRDLQRRLNDEFIPDVQSDIGTDVWNSLPSGAQAALVSVAYNYGSLPSKVIKAAKTGDLQTLADAVASLRTHNQGINSKRRMTEASLITG